MRLAVEIGRLDNDTCRILGGLAVDPLVSLVDTAFVGRLGTVELAALGVNASLFAFTFIVFNLFYVEGTDISSWIIDLFFITEC